MYWVVRSFTFTRLRSHFVSKTNCFAPSHPKSLAFTQRFSLHPDRFRIWALHSHAHKPSSVPYLHSTQPNRLQSHLSNCQSQCLIITMSACFTRIPRAQHKSLTCSRVFCSMQAFLILTSHVLPVPGCPSSTDVISFTVPSRVSPTMSLYRRSNQSSFSTLADPLPRTGRVQVFLSSHFCLSRKSSRIVSCLLFTLRRHFPILSLTVSSFSFLFFSFAAFFRHFLTLAAAHINLLISYPQSSAVFSI